LSGAVYIRVNGALIGMGELVEIDGQVGVTLIALGTSSVEAK
jgi:flagellar motor switch/type III secretory pathway protein FliN